MHPLGPILLLLLTLPLTSAWGELGHRTVAYVAEKYFDDATATYVDGLLDSQDIGNASMFADIYKIQHGHAYTKPWHYINAHDKPPAFCNVTYNRDCIDDCILKAIVNQTSIVNDPDWTRLDRQHALKFLIHFIGDIHQPLHTELIGLGGTQIQVEFDNKHDDLHAIWDNFIPEKRAKKRSDTVTAAARKWAKKLHDAAETGGPPDTMFADLKCDDFTDVEDCALLWANDSNDYVCTHVFPDGVDAVKGVDLGGDYYDHAFPAVEALITRAGKRLAVWCKALQLQAAAITNAGNANLKLQATEEL